MFTGIIEEVGQVKRIQHETRTAVLTIGAKLVLEDAKVGDSIAVNGVCLTITSLASNQFTADVMPETFKRSALGQLKPGSPVNLERAMPANGRFGGHIVSGHIDGTGTISRIRPEGNAVWYTITPPAALLRYIVEKGSIAIDGISLTVADVTAQDFSVSIIPHTQAETTLAHRRVGDKVNLETDCIGKYVEKLLGMPQTGVTAEFLNRCGF